MDKNKIDDVLRNGREQEKLALLAKATTHFLDAIYPDEAPDFVITIDRPDGASVVTDCKPERVHELLSNLVLAMEDSDTTKIRSTVRF